MLCSAALWCFVYKYLFPLKVFFSSSSCMPICMQWSGLRTYRFRSSPRLLWVCWAALLSNRLYLSVLPQLQLRLLSTESVLSSGWWKPGFFCCSERSDSYFVFTECCTSYLVSAGDRNWAAGKSGETLDRLTTMPSDAWIQTFSCTRIFVYLLATSFTLFALVALSTLEEKGEDHVLL